MAIATMALPSETAGKTAASGSDEDVASAAMERYAGGDESAFADLYDLLAPRLYDYLASQVRNRALAEDLVQQTFLQLHRARGSFLAGADVRPWAFAIARRLMIDGFRRNKLETAQLAEESRKPEGGSAEAPDQQLAAKQLAARVADALDKMPESQRTAFQLVKQNGLSLAQAAEVLGTTITAVKLRLHRAVQGLRAVTGDESGDFE
jgi:RNA polymerase sigma-70 factor (ECF subfamily)